MPSPADTICVADFAGRDAGTDYEWIVRATTEREILLLSEEQLAQVYEIEATPPEMVVAVRDAIRDEDDERSLLC